MFNLYFRLMKKNRTILCVELLKSFSKDEKKHFKQFLRCKMFNKDKRLIRLFKALIEDLNCGCTNEAIQAKAYIKVYGDENLQKTLNPSQITTINLLLNNLLRTAELFLSIKVKMKNTKTINENMLEAILEKGQNSLITKHLNKFERTAKAFDPADLENSFKVNKFILNYLYSESKISEEENLIDTIKSLDQFYLINRLKLHLSSINIHRLRGKNYNEELISSYESLLNVQEYIENPIIKLYLKSIELTEFQSEKTFYQLFSLLKENYNNTPKEIIKEFYKIMISFCVRLNEAGNQEYNQKMYELYKSMHEDNLLIQDGIVAIHDLKNAITISCKVENFDWAQQTLSHYKNYINKNVRSSVRYFNLGVIDFYKKKFDQANTNFSKVEKIDSVYERNTKVMLLKCRHEEIDPPFQRTLTYYQSAKKYFKNCNSLTQEKKIAYDNFIKILILLHRIKSKDHTVRHNLKQVKTILKDQKLNSDKRWLDLKIKELESKLIGE